MLQTWQWLRRPTEFLSACAAQYGDLFCIRPYMDRDTVMVCHPAAIRQIFAATADEAGQQPAEEFAQLLGRYSLFVIDGAEHARMRRFVMPTLSPERTKDTLGLLYALSADLLDSWPLGTRFCLQKAMQTLTMQTVLDSLLGTGCAECVRVLTRLFEATYAEFASPFMLVPIQWQSRLGRGPWVTLVRLARRAGEVLRGEIQRRRDTKEAAGSDVLSQLLAARAADGSAMTDAELEQTLITLLIAGHDTTANALAWGFACLLDDPALCARLRQELTAAQRGSALDLEKVMTLPLLDATVKEVLRLHPIFPGTYRELWRPMQLLGHDLPAGTRVVACIYLVQRRPELFPEPDRFLPDRFLNRTPSSCEWIPFGGGQRRCPGGAWALAHLKVVLATVLHRAILQPAAGMARRTVRAFISLAPAGGVPAVLVSRTEGVACAAPWFTHPTG